MEHAGNIETMARRAREMRDDWAAARLRNIATRAAAIDAEDAMISDAITRKRAEEDDLKVQLALAEGQGRGPTMLERARSDVMMLRDEGPVVETETVALDGEDEAIRADAKKVEQATSALRELEEAETTKQRARNEKDAEASSAAKIAEEGRRLLANLRAAEKEEARAAKKAEKSAEAALALDEAVNNAAALEQKAKAKREDVASALAAAQRREAAHVAALGVKTGDPCPICDRALPAGFRVPCAPALESAQKKFDEANSAHEEAKQTLIKAQERAGSKRDVQKEDEGALRDRRTEVDAAKKALLTAQPGRGEAVERLAKTEERASALAMEAAQARAHVETAHDEVTKARTALDGEKKRLKERRDAAKKAREALVKRWARLDEAHGRLPMDLAPKVPVSGDEAATLLGHIEAWLEQFRRTEKMLEDARVARRQIEEQRAALTQRRRTEIETPAHEIQVKLGTAADRVAVLGEALQFASLPEWPEQAALSEVAAWAEVLAGHTVELLGQCDAAVAAARAEAAGAGDQARRTLADAGVEDESALNAALIQAQAAKKRADEDLDRAEREKPIAADLDARVARAVALSEALIDVRGLLADGKLVQHIVSKKQQALLGVASETLSSMTRDRYGFSADFNIVDRLTGQARGTRTLSGGETFLASLALALGLVELAGRSGGRLDALFLDEGFGSLDAGSLSEALVALTKLADRGRLVAVISHVQAVAEAIDKVLGVKLGPAGSRAEWVTGPERDAMLAEDVKRGLLA